MLRSLGFSSGSSVCFYGISTRVWSSKVGYLVPLVSGYCPTVFAMLPEVLGSIIVGVSHLLFSVRRSYMMSRHVGHPPLSYVLGHHTGSSDRKEQMSDPEYDGTYYLR